MSKTVIGLFDDRAEAEAVVQQLIQEGFPREHISLVARGEAGGEADTGAADRESSHATESAKGAGIGAGTGAVVGGVGGLLIGLGLLAIPGLGPLVAAGPLAATLAGAGVGAVAGGLLGALIGMGVPKEEAEAYAEGVRRGGALVTLQTEDERADAAVRVMHQHGAVDIRRRAGEWRQAGWTGYDPKAPAYSAEEAARERALYRTPGAPEAASAHQAVMERGEARASRAGENRMERPTSESAPSVGADAGAEPVSEFAVFEPEFRKDFETTLANRGLTYEHHVPAYRYGYLLATDPQYRERDWESLEGDARAYWEERNPGTWDQFRNAVRYAWETVRRKT